MGFLDLLSPTLTVATKAVGDYETAQSHAKQQQVKDAIQRVQLQRQAEQDRIRAAIEQRQAQSAGLADKLTGLKIQQEQYELDHPKPQAYQPTSFEEVVQLTGAKAREEAKYRAPREAPVMNVAQREDAAAEAAYRAVQAAGGDVERAMAAMERDKQTARGLGLRRDHYYAAARRFQDRFTGKSKSSGPGDPDDPGAVVDSRLKGRGTKKPSALPPQPGNINLGKTLSPGDRAKAQQDPNFAAFLRSQGYSL